MLLNHVASVLRPMQCVSNLHTAAYSKEASNSAPCTKQGTLNVKSAIGYNGIPQQAKRYNRNYYSTLYYPIIHIGVILG